MLQQMNATMNSFYQYNQDATMNTDATTKNTKEYYRLKLHTRAHGMSGLPALIKVSVIIFVIICKVQLTF